MPGPVASKDVVQYFIEALYGSALERNYWLALWCLPSKATHWHRSVGSAVKCVLEESKKQSVYSGAGLFKTKPKRGRGRGVAADVACLPALWLDVDFMDHGDAKGQHKKANLPPTQEAASGLLDELGLRPSLVVHSGHGLQAWWLFQKPWELQDEPTRAKAGALAKTWNATAQALAAKKGWTVDSVHDLARVMRVAGSVNRKGRPIITKLLKPALSVNPVRYVADEIQPFLIAEELGLFGPAGGRRKTKVEPVDPVKPRSSTAILPKIEALCQNDPRFRRTWNRERTDMVDQSASGYDLALANLMVQGECTDQNIADAIHAWRVKHGQNPEKADRRDYIMRTIGRARTDQAAEKAVNDMPAVAHGLDMSTEDTAEREQRQKTALESVSKAIGVNVVKVLRHGRENSIFNVILAEGTDVLIGKIAAILNQDRFREAIAEATGVVMRLVKKASWHQTASVLLSVAELIENIEASRSVAALEWIRRYVEGREGSATVFSGSDWSKALMNSDPFIRDDHLHIHTASFGRFLRFDLGERIKDEKLWDMLRVAGFEPKRVGSTIDGKKVGRYYWRGPMALVDDETRGDTTTEAGGDPVDGASGGPK